MNAQAPIWRTVFLFSHLPFPEHVSTTQTLSSLSKSARLGGDHGVEAPRGNVPCRNQRPTGWCAPDPVNIRKRKPIRILRDATQHDSSASKGGRRVIFRVMPEARIFRVCLPEAGSADD